MGINPHLCKSNPLYSVLMLMAGTMLTGCDRQSVPGSVPFQGPGQARQTAKNDENKGQEPDIDLPLGDEATLGMRISECRMQNK